MKSRIKTLLISAFLAFTAPLFATDSDVLPLTDDCSGDVIEASEIGIPILLVFGAEDCGYCERLKNEVLVPGLKNHDLDRKVLIREIDINAGGKIIDFDGDKIRNRMFVERYNIYATPTIVIVDYDGTPLADPIVGYDNADDYKRKLYQRIEYSALAMEMASIERDR